MTKDLGPKLLRTWRPAPAHWGSACQPEFPGVGHSRNLLPSARRHGMPPLSTRAATSLLT